MDGKKCLSSLVQQPSKMRKYLSNVQKMRGAHFLCVINHYEKFEYKGIKTVGVRVTDYTNQTPSKHFGRENLLSSTPLKNEKILT